MMVGVDEMSFPVSFFFLDISPFCASNGVNTYIEKKAMVLSQ